jgi:HEAT repeat protein
MLTTTPTIFEEVTDYEQPFFEFFQIVYLKELSPEEVELVLRKQAEIENDSEFLQYLDRRRSRLRALYHFSGGNPRLSLLLYELLAHQRIGELKIELEMLLDKLTPFYQERMKDLAPQECKLLETMSLLPEGYTPNKLAEAARTKPEKVRSLLHRLENSGYVRCEFRSGKKAIYIIPERFFRIWHQLNHSRTYRRRIQHLLEFFSTWYATREERDLVWNELSEEFRIAVETGSEERAADIDIYMDYIASVSKGSEQYCRLFDRLRLLIDSGELKKIMKEIEHLDAEYGGHGDYFVHKGEFLARELGWHDLALEAFLKAVEFNRSNLEMLFNQGVALDKLGRLGEARHAYQQAIELMSTKRRRRAVESTTEFLIHILREEQDYELVKMVAYLIGRTADIAVCPELIYILTTSDHCFRREQCAVALGLLRCQEAVPALLECLEADPDSPNRGAAATALGRIGSSEAVPALIEALKDEANEVRGSAATALGQIGSSETVPALIECLEADPDSPNRGAAATALGLISSSEAVPALLECLEADPSSFNRGAVATALGRISSSEAVPGLIEALKDEANNVRGSAATALGRIGTEEALSGVIDFVPELIKRLQPSHEKRLTAAINLLLRSTFQSGNLQLIEHLVQKVVGHLPDFETICQPHIVALKYLIEGRERLILEKQHSEVRDAAELLINAFDAVASSHRRCYASKPG